MSELDFSMNVSATLNILRLLFKPSLCLPHATVSTFNDLPIPLTKAFQHYSTDRPIEIQAVVLDKDDCFAYPKSNEICKPYRDKFKELRQAYPGSRLLIVSNSAGTSDDPSGADADTLEQSTGVTVLRHSTKKPGCGSRILEYLRAQPQSAVERPDQIVVIGDRLFTDIMMANLVGAWGIWVKDGVVQKKNLVSIIKPSQKHKVTEQQCSSLGGNINLRDTSRDKVYSLQNHEILSRL